MSHEITACRRKWQLMKSPRSRSHRQRELGSEILNTKSHFWFGSWWNSEPKLENVRGPCPKSGQVSVTRRKGNSCLWTARGSKRRQGWAWRLGWRSVMMMLRGTAAAKMDWPKLGLIKSQGWRCSSADIISIKMIIAGAVWLSWTQPVHTSRHMSENYICILTDIKL